MPGGRLTQDDRRQVAGDLAGGLGYAEIARRLDRPTSTVSREVARNGGPGGYHADAAHRRTTERARRRGPAAPPRPPEGGDETVRAFTEEFALAMVANGLPRMAARVFARLFVTDDGSLTAAELVRHLQVSPASVSKAIGYLEGLDLLERDRDSGRRERYRIGDDVWFGAWSASARSTANWADVAKRGAEVLDPGTPAGARLAEMGAFFGRLSEDMSGGTELAGLEDALTLFAGLLHAARPLTEKELATALGWTTERVGTAIRDAERHPDLGYPAALRCEGDGYRVGARLDRLTRAQRTALRPGG